MVYITYGDNGDNGDLLDDVFQLRVNGQIVRNDPLAKRVIGPIEVALTEGQHIVELIGIEADDGIGTYYIDFSGDVLSVSGDLLEGRDLLQEDVKVFYLDVGPNSEPVANQAEQYLNNLQAELK